MKSIRSEDVLLEVERTIYNDGKIEYYYAFMLIAKRGMNLHAVFDLKFEDIKKEDGRIMIGMDCQGNRDANVNIIFPEELEKGFVEYLEYKYCGQDEAYVFGNKRGERMQDSRLSCYLQEISKILGVADLNSRELKKLSQNQKYDYYINLKEEEYKREEISDTEETFKGFVSMLANIEESKVKSTKIVLEKYNELCQKQVISQVKELYEEIQRKYEEIKKII